MQDAQATLRSDDTVSLPDIILPSQYFGSVGSVGLSNEQRLVLAMLADAINVLQSWKGSGSPHARCNFAKAVQWVNTSGNCHAFSFDSVCDALDIDSELLRSRLRALTIRSVNSAARPGLARLRLKEVSRSQHLSLNRFQRREHVLRIETAPVGRGPRRKLPQLDPDA
ncbi:MAG: hypothetical protein JO189_10305 [Deltaproteobacteria bacterium]|nr:hypothetical protein [Deltaproteobacteria bacterium]